MGCEHEDELKKTGWKPEITLTVYAKEGEEDREIHYHGPDTIYDLAAILEYLTHRIMAIEEEREKHE